jgi:hypothetical protein
LDFTLKAYLSFLLAIVESGYRVITVRDYLTSGQPSPFVILRHDVEWSPRRARDIADAELRLGLRSTFYFRANTRAYDIPLMLQLQNDGFEIGYHYDTLDRCNGDFDKAIALFEEELARFRLAGVSVQTVCSHGNPRVRKRGYQANYDIFLKDEGLKRRVGILGEAYLDLDFSAVKYLSDAGIRWNVGLTTRQIEALIRTKEQPAFYILVHPDYWSRSWIRALALKCAARGIKIFRINNIIAAIREYSSILSRTR